MHSVKVMMLGKKGLLHLWYLLQVECVTQHSFQQTITLTREALPLTAAISQLDCRSRAQK